MGKLLAVDYSFDCVYPETVDDPWSFYVLSMEDPWVESREVMELKEQVENLKRQLADKEPPRSPLQKLKPGIMVERTPPPRPRRLSLENKCPPPKSPNAAPPSSASKNRALKPDGKTRVSTLVLPKTPESKVSIRNEIVISSEIKASAGNGKSSSHHIRKSLRTIGKLMIGSDKRAQLKPIEGPSPSVAVITRPSRRLPLTGIQPLEKPRRSSIGGVDSCK